MRAERSEREREGAAVREAVDADVSGGGHSNARPLLITQATRMAAHEQCAAGVARTLAG